jgi:hypothetical protein
MQSKEGFEGQDEEQYLRPDMPAARREWLPRRLIFLQGKVPRQATYGSTEREGDGCVLYVDVLELGK